MNAVISQYYFKMVRLDFLTQVLCDEYFNFALRRNLLKKICPSFGGKVFETLGRLNTIRNLFAHCNLEMFKGPEKPNSNSVGTIFNPRNPREELDFKLMHQEFIEKEKAVLQFLIEQYQERGGVLD